MGLIFLQKNVFMKIIAIFSFFNLDFFLIQKRSHTSHLPQVLRFFSKLRKLAKSSQKCSKFQNTLKLFKIIFSPTFEILSEFLTTLTIHCPHTKVPYNIQPPIFPLVDSANIKILMHIFVPCPLTQSAA